MEVVSNFEQSIKSRTLPRLVTTSPLSFFLKISPLVHNLLKRCVLAWITVVLSINDNRFEIFKVIYPLILLEI
jgi:hypothetical protein